MVVAAHPLASAAGAAMLAAGGNAVDAAIAASFVISVVRPQSTGVGGGGFMLLHEKKTANTKAYDFRERAPRAASAAAYEKMPPDATLNGAKAVATPGLVPGLAKIHAKHGKLPWKRVLQPSIAAAREGFEVYQQLADALSDRRAILEKYPESKAIFFRNGRPLRTGETLVQTDLAHTLERTSRNGGLEFTHGETARRMVSAVKMHGGILDSHDLASYKLLEHRPVSGEFAGKTVISMPPPSSGGIAIIEIFNILSADIDRLSKAGFASYEHWHFLAEAMRRAFADRANFLGDPAFVKVPIERLTSLAHAVKWRSGINPDAATASRTLPVDPAKPSAESGSTTHISVVDNEGNAVATTQTINYSFGSCLVAAGTGVVLNDEMDDFARGVQQPNAYGLVGSAANAIAPGKTPLSSMTPSIVLDNRGEVEIIAGSPGGPRIISATLQVIMNRLVFAMSALESVHAPRIHHQWLPDKLFVELKDAPPSTVKDLQKAGHTIENMKQIGDVQAVFIDDRQSNDHSYIKFTGVSDIRSDGIPSGI